MSFERLDWLKQAERYVWTPRSAALPAWKKRVVGLARLLVVLVRDVAQGEIRLWTMSLVYTTLLSMVPLLALSFSVLKAFGVHNQVEPLLDNLLAPLGAQAAEVSRRLIGFIEHMNVGVLGALGLAMLVYTVVSLMQKVEESFNSIWHVTQLRPLGERFSRYLSVLLVGPLLVFAALGLTAAALSSSVARDVLSEEALGSVALTAGKLMPYLLVIGAFTFLYVFVPNTRVRWKPALVAGIVGGVLWQTAGWGFGAFVVSSTRYAAIYSSFAILVLLLIWLYVSWLVLLVGVAVSFYVQHPEYLYAKPGEPRLSNRMRERLGLSIMHAIGTSFVRGEPPWTLERLTRHFGIPMHSVAAMLEALGSDGFLAPTQDNPPAYLPLRDPSGVSAAEILAAVRRTGEDGFLNSDSLALAPCVQAIIDSEESAIAAATGGVTVGAMVDRMHGPDRSGSDEVPADAQPQPWASAVPTSANERAISAGSKGSPS